MKKRSKIMKEEVLFKTKKLWPGTELPITLITYPKGSMDVHCQTGDKHNYMIGKARSILKKRGLSISKNWEFIGGTGAYYSVSTLKDKEDD